jgi:polysaccharide biosynthesis/export protein
MKFNGVKWSIAWLISACCVWSALAQTQRPAPTTSSQPATGAATGAASGAGNRAAGTAPSVLMSSDGDYQVAPSDVIEVVVDDAPELSVKYRINTKGMAPMRYLGNTYIAGMTCDEISKMIADALRGRYLKDPKVYVSVAQYNSRSFFIQGAVRQPGVFVIEGKPSLFKLITIAGGLQENHGSTAYIFRETKTNLEKLETGQTGAPAVTDATGAAAATGEKQEELSQAVANAKGTDGAQAIEGESEYELITANIGGIMRGRLSTNFIVQPSDVVYVPPGDVFYVSGEVRAPGQYPLRQGITIRQAISLAQGAPFKAKLDKAVIFREDPVTNKFTEVPIDIAAILAGKKDDMPVYANDVIFVPNSMLKSVSSVLLTTLGTSAILRIPLGR